MTWPYKDTRMVYLDSAASTQKPSVVINAVSAFYSKSFANVHRGLYPVAQKATQAYEEARKTVADFLGCDAANVVFTGGTTDAMNLLAHGYPLTADDVVVLSEIDHHSTIVPWQQAAKRAGAELRWIPSDDGRFDYTAAEKLLKGATVVALSALSNVTGEVLDISRVRNLAEDAVLVLDGAQHAAHLPVDLDGVDAYAFSSHKVYGPTGVGALYMSDELMKSVTPYRFGGEMVDVVQKEKTTFQNGVHRFEAGTPPIAQAIGFASALKWLSKQDHSTEQDVVLYLQQRLRESDAADIFVDVECPVALVSFTVPGVHAHDVAEFLGRKNIAVRAGHHCCQPLHDSLGIPASVRASIGLYNSKKDVDALIDALKECVEAFDV